MDQPLSYYIDRYTTGSISSEELKILVLLLKEPSNRAILQQMMDDSWTSLQDHEMDFPDVAERVENALRQRINTVRIVESIQTPPVHRVHLLKTSWFRYAAAIVILLGIGAYFWFNNFNEPSTIATTKPVLNESDVAPGHDGAILTLADGRKVVLDSMGYGTIAVQNGAEVVLKDGQLAYDPSGTATGNVVYNTMQTPKGRQFKVTLPDGTRVWLNSASSIRYPTVFTGNERKVNVTGEVYFEVAKNAKMPFKVKVNDDAEIQVLGTSFNINAYENEAAVKTTLLEGSIRVTAYNQLQTLKPAQQAQLTTDKKLKVVDNADVEKAIAWKNGYFSFKGATIDELLRQLERWYDIEVSYEKGIPDVALSGEMTRDIPLNTLLPLLKGMGLKYRLEDRKLIVLP